MWIVPLLCSGKEFCVSAVNKVIQESKTIWIRFPEMRPEDCGTQLASLRRNTTCCRTLSRRQAIQHVRLREEVRHANLIAINDNGLDPEWLRPWFTEFTVCKSLNSSWTSSNHSCKSCLQKCKISGDSVPSSLIHPGGLVRLTWDTRKIETSQSVDSVYVPDCSMKRKTL